MAIPQSLLILFKAPKFLVCLSLYCCDLILQLIMSWGCFSGILFTWGSSLKYTHGEAVYSLASCQTVIRQVDFGPIVFQILIIKVTPKHAKINFSNFFRSRFFRNKKTPNSTKMVDHFIPFSIAFDRILYRYQINSTTLI